MDLQIDKKNGESIKLEDYGIDVADFIVSSIPVESNYQNVESRNGNIDYGATYGTRTITVPFVFNSYDLMDFTLIRDKVFGLLTSRESYYIRERRRVVYDGYGFTDINEIAQPKPNTENVFASGKRYLVRLQNKYELEQTLVTGKGELIFETTELPFAESVGTTDDIDIPNMLILQPYKWEQGYINNSTGENIVNSKTLRFKDFHSIKPNEPYVLDVNGEFEVILLEFDSEKNIIKTTYAGLEFGKVDFITDKRTRFFRTYLRRYRHSAGNKKIYPYMIGDILKPTLFPTTSNGVNSNDGLWAFGMGIIPDKTSWQYSFNQSEFKVYNAGNTQIHPFEQQIKIEISNVINAGESITLKNNATGDSFTVNDRVSNSQTIVLDGANITSNGLQYLRKTNKQFITLDPGWNNFHLTGCKSANIRFTFRFHYL